MSKDSTGRESGGVEKDLKGETMEAKHTPGAMRAALKIINLVNYRNFDALTLACEHGVSSKPTTSQELAAFIDEETAAPEMLAALKNTENDDGHIPPSAWKLIQDAIAKAEGES